MYVLLLFCYVLFLSSIKGRPQHVAVNMEEETDLYLKNQHEMNIIKNEDEVIRQHLLPSVKDFILQHESANTEQMNKFKYSQPMESESYFDINDNGISHIVGDDGGNRGEDIDNDDHHGNAHGASKRDHSSLNKNIDPNHPESKQLEKYYTDNEKYDNKKSQQDKRISSEQVQDHFVNIIEKEDFAASKMFKKPKYLSKKNFQHKHKKQVNYIKHLADKRHTGNTDGSISNVLSSIFWNNPYRI